MEAATQELRDVINKGVERGFTGNIDDFRSRVC